MPNKTKLPPNHHIGILFTAVFALIAIWPMFFGQPPRYWSATICLATLLITILKPQWLTPFNRAWMKLGEMMSKVVNPIVLGVLFFLVITPIALIMRATGRDTLNRKIDPSASTYWIERCTDQAPPQSMTQQF